MSEVYLSTAYLAPVQYYSKLLRYDTIRLEAYENFPKQTYRNRCVIAAANGPLTLSVPVEKSETLKCLTRDIRVSDHGNWRHLHSNIFNSGSRHLATTISSSISTRRSNNWSANCSTSRPK